MKALSFTIDLNHYIMTETKVEAAPTPEKAELTIYLLQVSCEAERQILEQWIRTNIAVKTESLTLSFPKKQSTVVPPGLELRLDSRNDDPLLAPTRVAWLPKMRGGRRDIRPLDLLLVGDPRRPRNYAKKLIAKRQPDRFKVLLGEPARLSELRKTWMQQAAGAGDSHSFAGFVVRRATLSLEREQSRLLGPQYKMPRLVKEDIRSSTRFRQGLTRAAKRARISGDRAEKLVDVALGEMASGYTPLGIDVNRSLGRLFYRQAYDEPLDYEAAQVENIRDAFLGKPAILLPSHRSNLDAGVVANACHELGLPKTSTVGGINMAFWPIGYLFRRSGLIFIRRNANRGAQRDPMYRWVLTEYLGYILEKGFKLEWYIEGGRSRTGKTLPPKLGLLKSAMEAYREGRIEDLALIPASISYDYINDVEDYAGESLGKIKKPENIGWYIQWFRSLRGKHYGNIYLRFGEPVSVAEALGSPQQAASLGRKEYTLALHKLAFEVSWRINKITPMTSTSLITMTLLSAFNQALSLPQLCTLLKSFVRFADAHELPLTKSARQLLSENGVREQLEDMIERKLVKAETDGPEAVYTIGPDQHVAASFYRNSVIHHFLVPAICEIALMAGAKTASGNAIEVFWETAFELRDLLKFDFFFLEKSQFGTSLGDYLNRVDTQWQNRLEGGVEPVTELLGAMDPLTAESVLRSFLESYWIVGHCLQMRLQQADKSPRDFVRFCAGTARQYLLQRRIQSSETGSLLIYPAGVDLARNRGLIGDVTPERAEALKNFAGNLRHLLDLIDEIQDVGRRAFNSRLYQKNNALDLSGCDLPGAEP
jgi:glycerol-3-phosphate O-acyltransferase